MPGCRSKLSWSDVFSILFHLPLYLWKRGGGMASLFTEPGQLRFTESSILRTSNIQAQRPRFMYFFEISIGIKRRMLDIGKKYLFTFCKMFENVLI
jgi:hypothetical protein